MNSACIPGSAFLTKFRPGLAVFFRNVYNMRDYDQEETGSFYKVSAERIKMRKLALSDKVLLNIEKPARYIGNEVNSVMKDKEKVDIRFCMCFPDVTE